MAEAVIIKSFQRNYFPNELEILEEKGIFNKTSSINKLDPYFDRFALLLVGSQIRNSVISEGIKQPMFLTRNDH